VFLNHKHLFFLFKRFRILRIALGRVQWLTEWLKREQDGLRLELAKQELTHEEALELEKELQLELIEAIDSDKLCEDGTPLTCPLCEVGFLCVKSDSRLACSQCHLSVSTNQNIMIPSIYGIE
jgi:hypothetical protein